MAPRPTNWRMYGKMLFVGVVVCVGGPALTYWVTPTEEELFLKYNPELQKRSLANRQATQQEFDDFVNRLKEYSKSDKPIWIAAAEAESRKRAEQRTADSKVVDEINARKAEMKKDLT
ncbi:hypothetical protein F5884DRAFT_274787 [Xylogone sp. PMI_703]|nr:hypothetical protein F5884DRAFT_274787 [Xylogone sp. PMI_703]